MVDVCIKCGKRPAEIGLLCSSCYNPVVKLPKPITIKQCRACHKFFVGGKWQHMSREELEAYVASKVKGEFKRAFYDLDEGKVHVFVEGNGGKEFEYTFPLQVKIEKVLCPSCSREHGGYYEAVFQLRGDRYKQRKLANEFIRYARGKTFITKTDEKKEGMDIYVGSSKVLIQFLADKRIKDYKLSRKLHTQKEGKRLYRITIALRLGKGLGKVSKG